MRFADQIRREALGWDSFDRWTLGIQMVRAADSIGANIAEGMGRATNRDQRRFLVIARGSMKECEHWVDRAQDRGLLDGDFLSTELLEVARMLNGLIASIDP